MNMGSKSTLTDYHAPGSREQVRRPYSLMGPVILITLGVLFLVGQYFPAWGIGRTWPVLLVVIGLTKLFEAIVPGKSRISPEGVKPPSEGGNSR